MDLSWHFKKLNLSYTLEKIGMRVALLDPAQAGSKSHATEMFSWNAVDSGLEQALTGLEREWMAAPNGLPDQASRLIERARVLQAEIRRAISRDELGQDVDFRRSANAYEEFKTVLTELEALAAQAEVP